MGGDDFYEDDEPIEDIRAAVAAGEEGITVSRKDLNQRAASIVAQIAEASEAEMDLVPDPIVVEYDAEDAFLVDDGPKKVWDAEEPPTSAESYPVHA